MFKKLPSVAYSQAFSVGSNLTTSLHSFISAHVQLTIITREPTREPSAIPSVFCLPRRYCVEAPLREQCFRCSKRGLGKRRYPTGKAKIGKERGKPYRWNICTIYALYLSVGFFMVSGQWSSDIDHIWPLSRTTESFLCWGVLHCTLGMVWRVLHPMIQEFPGHTYLRKLIRSLWTSRDYATRSRPRLDQGLLADFPRPGSSGLLWFPNTKTYRPVGAPADFGDPPVVSQDASRSVLPEKDFLPCSITFCDWSWYSDKCDKLNMYNVICCFYHDIYIYIYPDRDNSFVCLCYRRH